MKLIRISIDGEEDIYSATGLSRMLAGLTYENSVYLYPKMDVNIPYAVFINQSSFSREDWEITGVAFVAKIVIRGKVLYVRTNYEEIFAFIKRFLKGKIQKFEEQKFPE